jgi:hypothetical protein
MERFSYKAFKEKDEKDIVKSTPPGFDKNYPRLTLTDN